jgi:hypothetical protein
MEKKMSKKEQTELINQIPTLLTQVVMLNLAVAALCKINRVKGNELNNVKAVDFKDYVEKNVHPLVAKAVELNKEIVDSLKEKEDDNTTE